MAPTGRSRRPLRASGRRSSQTFGEQYADRRVNVALIFVHRQHVAGLPGDDMLGDLFLAAHGVDGDQAARNLQDWM